jgi:hypothetical protein
MTTRKQKKKTNKKNKTKQNKNKTNKQPKKIENKTTTMTTTTIKHISPLLSRTVVDGCNVMSHVRHLAHVAQQLSRANENEKPSTKTQHHGYKSIVMFVPRHLSHVAMPAVARLAGSRVQSHVRKITKSRRRSEFATNFHLQRSTSCVDIDIGELRKRCSKRHRVEISQIQTQTQRSRIRSR